MEHHGAVTSNGKMRSNKPDQSRQCHAMLGYDMICLDMLGISWYAFPYSNQNVSFLKMQLMLSPNFWQPSCCCQPSKQSGLLQLDQTDASWCGLSTNHAETSASERLTHADTLPGHARSCKDMQGLRAISYNNVKSGHETS